MRSRLDSPSVSFSHAVFGRADWAVMLSCFACLWSEVIAKFVDTGVLTMSGLLDLLASDELPAIALRYRQTHGIAPLPIVLLEGYVSSRKTCKRRRRA